MNQGPPSPQGAISAVNGSADKAADITPDVLRPRRRGPTLSLLDGRPVTLLRLHGAAFMGIREPIPSDTPSPMGEEEAQWVRTNAWSPAIARIDQCYPHGYWRWCECERGICTNCVGGRHATCQTRTPKQEQEYASITTGRKGYHVASVIYLPHQRPCKWLCPCECTTSTTPIPGVATASSQPRAAVSRIRTTRPGTTEDANQGALFS